jgi:preprotein translocase subunit SecA
MTDENGQGFAPRLLSLVMLNVLDEKWKDHLYDLDQLRGAIHYRSWGQKDPLIEYKQEAYTMFVDLMGDIHHTFTERFLRAQLVFNPREFEGGGGAPDGGAPARELQPPRGPTKRFNALGILEDVVEPANGNGTAAEVPDERESDEAATAPAPVRTSNPIVVGAGRARSLNEMAGGASTGSLDFTGVGRNDPCPCGSGKKFKKCHGA